MKASTLIEIVCAAHYTGMVESPWLERGALMLVAPPGHLKSTWLFLVEDFPGVYLSSDLNVQMLGHLKDDIIGERIRTIVIPDIQKLYERHPMVSSNLEGSLRAMIEEGFVATSFQDASAISRKARVLLMTGATPSFYEDHLLSWRKSGFARRVLFSVFAIRNPTKIIDAVDNWRKLEVTDGLRFGLPIEPIPYCLTLGESKMIRHMLHQKQPDVTPFVLLKKIACVLRWRWKRLKVRGPDPTMNIIKDFAASLRGEGASITL